MKTLCIVLYVSIGVLICLGLIAKAKNYKVRLIQKMLDKRQ